MNSTASLEELMCGLPGEKTIRDGLRDLELGKETIASLLIAIGRPRLNGLGLAINLQNRMPASPEFQLYQLLCEKHGNEAHAQYNAWLRQLISFERALENRVSRKTDRNLIFHDAAGNSDEGLKQTKNASNR